MTTHVVSVDDHGATQSLAHVMRLLASAGLEVRPLVLSESVTLDREARQIEQTFRHTPEPLLATWRTARQLARNTEPGDVVVMSDYRGLGGIFALDQAAADPGQRRQLWTVAADSTFLRLRVVAKTHEGLPLPLESQVDWEMTQYRWSDRVITAAPLASAELAVIGVESELLGEPQPSELSDLGVDARHIWAPGPVSRRNRTGEVLRALTSVPNARVTLSDEDLEDQIWTGTAWDALRHSREVLGARVERHRLPPESPTTIVIGDPFSVPDPEIRRYRAEGIPALVPAGSVASVMWPDAPTWTGVDDLARLLNGAGGRGSEPIPQIAPAQRPTSQSYEVPGRARAVSVGIPIFRDVTYLRECVESVLKQDHAPVELLLVDDGSHSGEVDRIIGDLTRLDKRVQAIRTEHRGVCAARNAALEVITGDSFLFVDSDDILLPTFLSRCVAALNSRDDIWAVATWTEFFGSYNAVEAKPPFDDRVGRRENPIISTSALVDRKVLEAGIRFAPDLAFLYCEDWHFWSQIVAAGGRFGLVPEPLARHRVHPTSGGYMRTELAHALGRSRAIEPLRH